MKAAPFEYTRAASVDEAVALLAEHGDAAKPIAGGQSLVPMMAMRLARPAWLVDICRIPSLAGVTYAHDHVRIAACTRQCVLEADDALAGRVPLIRQALAWVGHVQTRNRGTVGGSLAHADPSAELPLVAQTLGATIHLRARSGSRTLDAAGFFAGPMMTAVDPVELVEAIDWPVWTGAGDGGGTGAAFDEIGIRHGDFAIVAACAQVTVDAAGRCTRAAFGLGGVDQTPLAFPDLAAQLVGTTLDDATIAAAADAAARIIQPGGDMHATPAYRKHLARTLAARTLAAARARAHESAGKTAGKTTGKTARGTP